MTFIDEEIGKIVDALKKKGIYDNSLICFISDHGDMLGDHNHWRKTYAYEGSSAIPFIVKLPANNEVTKKTGSVIEEPVEIRDVLPTFLEAANITIPQEMDGLPVQKLMTGKENEWRKYIDLEHATCYSNDNYWCALTDGKIKYIWFFNTAKEQLFDLEKDPQEVLNLVNNKKYKKQLENLRAEMVNHLSVRGDEWVKDGNLVQREKALLYSPNYPKKNK